MSTKTKKLSLVLPIILSAFFIDLGAIPIAAATIEVENDTDEALEPPTPVSASPKPKPAPQTKETAASVSAPAKPEKAVAPIPTRPPVSTPVVHIAGVSGNEKRVKIGDRVSFFYFMKAGYPIVQEKEVHSMGKVLGSFDGRENFFLTDKTYLDLSEKATIKPDDLLVVYHSYNPLSEPHMGIVGHSVDNLAVVKVLRVENRRAQVEVIKSFYPFRKGDEVKAYEDEVDRWKKAQIKKPLPEQAVNCYVICPSRTHDNLSPMEFVVLTAGTKKGVVEGQVFHLREKKDVGGLQAGVHPPVGTVKVFYATPDLSVALITDSREPIQSGFEAAYEP